MTFYITGYADDPDTPGGTIVFLAYKRFPGCHTHLPPGYHRARITRRIRPILAVPDDAMCACHVGKALAPPAPPRPPRVTRWPG